MSSAMKRDDVLERLTFVERRLQELLGLNDGDLPGADSSYRQQLVQEFFFHLVGAMEVLAQLVNEFRGLGIDPEDVSIMKVSRVLPTTDPVKAKLAALTAKTQGQPLPTDPYSDEGYIFRIRNYRHQVTHRRRNPFLFRVGAMPPASFLLDPRNPTPVPSEQSAQDELLHMFDLIKARCEEILALL
jgi:hypothetical protein